MSKKYTICYNKEIENTSRISEAIENILDKSCVNYDSADIENLKSDSDFAFVIGGDGTILKAARFYAKFGIPVFGINLGHLGFLSQACESEIKNSIKKILSSEYKIESRIMLESGQYIALNDFVVKGEDTSRAANFSLEIDGEFVCEYFADGLIVSTPTGSTAYGMAAGGPILSPNLDATVIVPICPHTFAARPLVVSSESKIKIITSHDKKFTASADGQNVFTFEKDIEIKKSNYSAKLALLNDNSFYSVLRNKLHWGISTTKCK